MLADSAILKEDMAWISSSDLPWDKLRNSTVDGIRASCC